MRTALAVLVLVAVSSATAKPKNGFTRFPSWNTRMYPVWNDGDPRYRDSWKGGEVKITVGNDAPTLTGAKVTFTIDLEFPHNQKVLPSGEVVWAQDCTDDGTNYRASEPVYPAQKAECSGVFPDGTPFKKDKKPSYVFVWKTWGQYWQVVDGPSSSLTISTDSVPLGSYPMDIVVYHCRSKEKFIPLGYASTQFSITDQIPFAVSLSQVNDIHEDDMSFVRNRAISFSIALHDPSQYLSSADITFNWDFGDSSGALISREPTVTHTYVTSGSYKPKVVIQAVIPDSKCANASTGNSVTSLPPSLAADLGTTGPAAATADTVVVSTQGTALNVSLGTAAPAESDIEEDATEVEASSTQVAQTLSPVNAGFPTGPAAAVAVEEADDEATTGPSAEEAAKQAAVAKRQADDTPSDDDCVIYRYGSFCTGINVVEGIENVEIIQVSNAVVKTADAERSVVDITVTCEGSLPSEVCSVVLDAECMRPVQMECNTVDPAPQCQLVLRHFFENSGVFCINVSMTNDVSLAVTSARVSVSVAGSRLSSSGTVSLVLGVMILALAVGTVAHIYKRSKLYRPLKEDNKTDPHVSQARGCVPGLFWNLLDRQAAQDHCPLLQDRLV